MFTVYKLHNEILKKKKVISVNLFGRSKKK
jgi:hypothetical protein